MDLHIHSGDVAAELARDRVGGCHLVYADLLMEGPLPAFGDAWSVVRGQVLAEYVPHSSEAIAKKLDGQLQAIVEAVQNADAVWLWFDDCMYDQLLMQFIVAHFLQGIECPVRRVCCPRSVAGFGELAGDAFASLKDASVEVSPAALSASRDVIWPAICSESPSGIEALAGAFNEDYPALQAAMKRLLEQLPMSHTGLNRLETNVIASVLDGTNRFVPLFERVSKQEETPFFGDDYLRAVVMRMASGDVPMVRVQGDIVTGTLQSMRTLWGWGDWRELNSVIRHVCNIRLDGDGEWRWDKWKKRCVRK